MYANFSGDWQGRMLNRYLLLRLLGRGGMGEVWLAEDIQLRRQVAAKLLPTVLAGDRSYLQKFEREARAAAALEHPHILPVHDFGEQEIAEDEVVTYLIMPYITGGSLQDRIGSVTGEVHNPLPTDEAMHFLRQAAEAIDYAHSQGVIHRDIKPANMLLQQDWLFLADFGIAKLLTSTTYRTRTNTGAGTPEYMAPEQVQGKAEFASDRYSLAVAAYLLLTGHLPFTGETYYNVLIKQIREAPPSPRQFNPSLPLAVEQVLLQGLAKQPEDRPASCVAFVDALAHGWQMQTTEPGNPEATVLAPWSKLRQENLAPPPPPDTPLLETPPVPVSQTAEPMAPVSQYGAGVAPTTPTAPGMPHPATYYSAPHTPASPSTPPLTPLPLPGVQQSKISRRTLLIGGSAALLTAIGGSGVALYTLLHHNPTGTPALMPKPTSHPASLPHPTPGPKNLVKGVPILSLTGHSNSVENAVWDSTGRYLATAGYDSTVMLWDIGSYLRQSSASVQSISTPLHRWKLANTVLPNALSWSPDGKTLGVVIGDNQIRLFDAFGNTDTPSIYQAVNNGNSPNSPLYAFLSWSPTANTFAAANTPLGKIAAQVDIWQKSNTTGPIRTLSDPITDHVVPLPLSEMHTYSTPPYVTLGYVDAMSWSTDGMLLAAHTNFNFVIIWDVATGAVKQVLRMRQGSPKTLIAKDALAWSPADPHPLVVSDIDVARLWDVAQNKVLLTLKVNTPYPSLTGLVWASNGKYVAGSYGRSRRIEIWDVQTIGPGGTQSAVRTPILSFPEINEPGHSATIFDIAWSPDGRYIATASGDNTVLVWKVDA